MGCAGFFVYWVMPLLTFKTQKFVVIQDWKLGLLLRLIQLAVFGYVLWDLINKEGYLVTQIPQGAVSSFTQGGPDYTIENMEGAFKNATHCTQPELYDFYYGPGFAYSDFACIATDPQGSSQKLESSIFVDTYFTENKLFTMPGKTEERCRNRVGDTVPPDANYMGIIEGSCIYSQQRHRFIAIPEDIIVSFQHRFSTTPDFDVERLLPTCYLRNQAQDDIIRTFEDGEPIAGLLSDWLQWSELDLDKSLDEQPVLENNKASFIDDALAQTFGNITLGLGNPNNDTFPDDYLIYPKLRLTGVNILVKLQYYNWRLAPFKDKIENKDHDIICVMDLDPILSWTSAGSQIHYALRDYDDPRFPTNGQEPFSNSTQGFLSVDMYRYGVKFTFQQTGVIGKFSVSALIQSITSGLVLLAFANTVVTMIALYLWGLRSQLYREFILEAVNWRQEYARFAAQAVVGAYVFNLMDADSSGSLNGVEMYAVLSKLFGHRMTTGQLAAVTDFVLRYGDDNKDKEILKMFQKKENKSVLSDNQISIDEWMQIFSTNKASIDSMIRTIESEYKNQKPKVTEEMRNAEPTLFKGITTPMKGDSAHVNKLDPQWKEIQMSKRV
eukprot:TRINITY_DN5061_c0_g2_i2.p1 TRINITY_DN5061_c0_g2~~TRINITY_DN5061_c0_g2_i2.p1  ORF type:complete len:610 (-),score=58.66 TRINITY_DN5061_c0_g2_i2:2162-3991(-)